MITLCCFINKKKYLTWTLTDINIFSVRPEVQRVFFFLLFIKRIEYDFEFHKLKNVIFIIIFTNIFTCNL